MPVPQRLQNSDINKQDIICIWCSKISQSAAGDLHTYLLKQSISARSVDAWMQDFYLQYQMAACFHQIIPYHAFMADM